MLQSLSLPSALIVVPGYQWFSRCDSLKSTLRVSGQAIVMLLAFLHVQRTCRSILNCLYVVPSEEEAQQKAHILAVQRELEEADEPNLLEEEGTDQVAISLLY